MMLSINRLLLALIQRSLAGVIVLSMSLMSLGVDSCETSCLVSHVRCADGSTQFSASAQPMSFPSMGMRDASEAARLAMRAVASSASQVPRMESVSCRSDEFCKDASTSIMRPSGRAEIQKARWMTFGDVFAGSEAPDKYLVSTPGSPHPGVIDPRFSMTLRI